MNGNKLFVDTNIVLYFLKGDPEVVDLISDKELVVSVITEITRFYNCSICILSENSTPDE
ncbi:MAG: hypothetical protein ACK4ND_14280 [Cytophagaceae bacterium]